MKEAMKLALEALEELICIERTSVDIERGETAIKALEEALAKQEQGEPVAWMRTSGTGSPVVTEALLVEMPEMRWNFQQPLYTTPPQRKPLTDEEIDKAWRSVDYTVSWEQHRIDIARAIEAAHGIKE